MSELALDRVRAASSQPVAEFRTLIHRYNRVVSDLDSFTLLYGDGLTQRLSRGKDLLPEPISAPIALTPFDFTSGFSVQCDSSYGSGLAVYRNQKTGTIVWKEEWKSGVMVSGTKASGAPIFQSSWKTGVSSAYNPKREAWETTDAGWKTPVASVYNAEAHQVEHRKGGWRTGIAGVYNPLSKRVEWKSEWSSGVAGYFDESAGRVVWKTEWKSGVACIWRDSNQEFHTSGGFFGGEVDDDD